ncbi:MAG: HlyD family efflux transporter periplasmic adaptor subunit [Rhodocyclaceae bacterium]|nr:HlyD family efflux transporter periplasmic adaptor subunit [Rhodocyclaceae bacterium]MCB1910278.1 HlyD family efflux transporter periplasmic adaptor subunit [Rhodocyclaceae bacterium]MCP5238593.1 HlyD family efflux transporter periplasmic adaptor subunit [Zoogloeaceae bacterium]MCP5295695.1 HlyD family efflux transporter periplasmic adaptor subunit [Zoogloeaceae bacterium]MCW5614951.1 HlyD family efflux transporter periplasmic adaptor subunit [Rhodocyclaceae bacterium]
MNLVTKRHASSRFSLKSAPPDAVVHNDPRMDSARSARMNAIDSSPHAQLALALRTQARLVSAHTLNEAAAALCNELCAALVLQNAYLGLLEGGTARLVAQAHGAGNSRRELEDPAVSAAMEEAMDQAATIVVPAAAGDDELHVTHAHHKLASATGAQLCSVPLMADDALIGALLVSASGETSLTASTREALEQVAVLAGPLLALRQRAEAPLLERLRHSLSPVRNDESRFRRTLAILAGGALLAGLLIPADRTVTAEARIEGEIQRALVAPADGYIEKAFVRPGDAVREGEVLLQLADRDLKLERRRLESELAQYRNAFAAAQSQADRSQMVVSDARAEEADARIALIDHQLERSLLRAPMDSIVLTGDLDQAQGTPVARGEVLLVVAPRSRYRLMIEVDERDIGLLARGARGELALAALPERGIAFEVKRIMPVTTEREGRHFVAVEAELQAPPAAAQPGMRGYARIEAGSEALLGQMTRRVRAWLGLELWARTGL